MVAIAPASAIAPHTAAAMRPVSWLSQARSQGVSLWTRIGPRHWARPTRTSTHYIGTRGAEQ